MEQPDHPCERCGRAIPRLIFDQWSERLLCEDCLEYMGRQQVWVFLREAETPDAASRVMSERE